MLSLELPQRGDSNEYTQYTFLNVKKKIRLNYHISATMGSVQRDQERVRNSRGKRSISVRDIEVLLYKTVNHICLYTYMPSFPCEKGTK